MSHTQESSVETLPRPKTTWSKSVLIGVGGAFAVVLVVLAFLWPAKTATPQHLPVSITGPAELVETFETAIAENSGDTFAFVEAADRDEAVAQIENRGTYGAIVLSAPPQAPEVLTAPAANAVATQMLTAMGAQLQAQLTQQLTAAGLDPQSATVAITPIVTLSADDSSGSGLAAASFPMMMGGMIGGVLVSLLVVGARRKMLALAGFAISVGLVLALVLQTWFAFLQGDFALNALGLGLSILATSAFIVGLSHLIGPAGIGLGAMITMLIANPLSAAASPWQFTPEPFGVIGQYLVPGASNWLLRSLSYFPDANNSTQWWVLCAWVALGVLLITLGALRRKKQQATTR